MSRRASRCDVSATKMLLDCRDSFFPKINFTEFHFRFMLLIAAPKGGSRRRADIRKRLNNFVLARRKAGNATNLSTRGTGRVMIAGSSSSR
jgi:hypothetical protein